MRRPRKHVLQRAVIKTCKDEESLMHVYTNQRFFTPVPAIQNSRHGHITALQDYVPVPSCGPSARMIRIAQLILRDCSPKSTIQQDSKFIAQNPVGKMFQRQAVI